jgi:hypothetical protein
MAKKILKITIEKEIDENYNIKKGDEKEIKSQVFYLLDYLDLDYSEIKVEIE